MEYLATKVFEIIEEIFIHILDASETIITNKRYPGLEDCQSNLNKKVSGLMIKLTHEKMSLHIQKLLRDAFVVANKDVTAFDPMIQYLDNIMSELNSSLTNDNFNKFSNFVWNEIIVQFKLCLQKQITTQQDVQVFASFKRCFEGIRESFGENAITSEENLEDLKFLEKELNKRGCHPLELIHTYYLSLREEHEKATETFGMLTFAGKFTKESLDLHILNGRNLVPKTGSDGETEPDTYVEVEFYFKDSSKYQLKSMKTKTIDKNQFPLYDEVLKM